MGTHPAYLLGITAYRMLERPWILGGMRILIGYLQAAITRMPRFESPGFREDLHRWQLSELKRRVFGRPAEPHLMFPGSAAASDTRLDEVMSGVDEELAAEPLTHA